MRRLLWYIAFFNGFSSSIHAFSQEKKNDNRIQKIGKQISEKECSDFQERRNFLGTSLGILSTLGTLASNPSSSAAADSPFGNNGSSKRLGGLSNKIRNICKNMVSSSEFCSYQKYFSFSKSFRVQLSQDELQRDLMQERW